MLDGVLFAPAVRATEDPGIGEVSGTESFALVGVPTRTAYFTLTLGPGSDGRVKVVDVLPNTPLEPAEA